MQTFLKCKHDYLFELSNCSTAQDLDSYCSSWPANLRSAYIVACRPHTYRHENLAYAPPTGFCTACIIVQKNSLFLYVIILMQIMLYGRGMHIRLC